MSRTLLSGRRVAAILGAGVLLLGASACGSSEATPASQGQQSAQQGQSGGAQGLPSGGQRFPGANGEVVAVSGDTAQVQSRQGGQATGQTAVTWNSETAFTRQVDATLADVKVGSCVMVTSGQAASTASGSTPGSDSDAPVAATVVRITTAAEGECGFGAGGPGVSPGGQSGGQDGEMPSPPDGASDMPSPPAGTQRGGFGGAFGKVTAVTGSGFTVESTRPGEDAASSVSVTVSGDTTYSKQAAATAAAVKTGVCVQARGESDDTGAITATTVQISPKVDGSCGGFGLGGMRGPGGSGDGQAGGSGQES